MNSTINLLTPARSFHYLLVVVETVVNGIQLEAVAPAPTISVELHVNPVGLWEWDVWTTVSESEVVWQQLVMESLESLSEWSASATYNGTHRRSLRQETGKSH